MIGSWLTSLEHMRELVERLGVRGLPEAVVTDRLGIDDADAAHRLAAEGRAGKVALVP